MRARQAGNALTMQQRRHVAELAAAAQGHPWESPQIRELVSYYRLLDVPWHVRSEIGGTELLKQEHFANGDVGAFVAGMELLSRCIDFGAPLSSTCDCEGCRRRNALLPEFYTLEQQQAVEREHGSLQCERAARFAPESRR